MRIPERVYELCRMTADRPASKAEMRDRMEPPQLNSSDTRYFGSVLTAAKELKLIEETDDGELLYVGDKSTIQNIDDFRRYCNSVLWQDKETAFYQIAVCMLASDLRWLKLGSLTSEAVLEDIRKHSNIEKLIAEDLRGIRFWMSFLGFGMVVEKTPIVFLPNMYVALRDFLYLTKPELKKEYTMSEFCKILEPYASVALYGVSESHQMNYAMSAALRMMQDTGEISLRRNQDSQEVWNLYRQEDHAVISEVTHVVVLKEVQ
jgi:hypothetical protein